MSRITNRLGWGVAGALAIALLATLAGVIYAGPLGPPAAPSATGPTQIFQPADCTGFPISIAASGSYVLEQNIIRPNGCAQNAIDIVANRVTLDLNGFTITGDSLMAGVKAHFTALVVIRNGTVLGFQSGIDTVDATQVVVEQVSVFGSADAGIGVGSDSLVTNSSASGSRTGISVTGDRSTITNNTASGNTCNGSYCRAISIYVVGTGSTITNNTASGNTCNDSYCDAMGIYVVGTGSTITNNTVGGNTCTGACFGVGIWVAGGGNAVVSGNTVSGNTTEGIFVYDGRNTISNNTVSANGNEGIHVVSSGNNIAENTVTGNNTATGSLAAINVFAGANRNRIDSNYIDANQASHAIEVDGTSNTITRNTGGNSTAAVFNFAGAGNTFGPVELQATPLTNPWANIVY